MKWFGLVALVGLGYFWLFERNAQAAPSGPRTLIASWERESDRGKIMADGRPHNPDKLTAASWDYKLGTKLRVTRGNVSCIVEICDRGPNKKYLSSRQLDLSKRAFETLAPLKLGLIEAVVQEL